MCRMSRLRCPQRRSTFGLGRQSLEQWGTPGMTLHPPEICARLAALERRVDALHRLVASAIGAAWDEARQQLTPDELRHACDAGAQAVMVATDSLRAVS